MTNFGERERLTVDGVPRRQAPVPLAGSRHPGRLVHRRRRDRRPGRRRRLRRLARRIGLGLARTGSVAHHGSGEIFLGVATGVRHDRDGRPDGPATAVGRALDHLFEAVVECAEEAVLNSLLTAPTVVGRDGNTAEGLVLPGWRDRR